MSVELADLRQNAAVIADEKHRIRLQFNGITYEIKKKTGMFWNRKIQNKIILKDISGVIEPGDLVALMGASGAGKSTLLNILSRRITNNEGTVYVNGINADKSEHLKSSSCFIQQEDLFYGFITVKEHLSQQARFRIALSKNEREKRVQDVMDRFSLNKSRNSRIGNVEKGASRGISGGEKKRLSLATELLINPYLIFADEPTSGLDAFMAESVVEVLKSLASSGHTVIATIHQPSSDVFAMFNKVLLLSEGRVMFFGPRLAAIPYFLRLGHPCPPYTNPADFLIELLAIDWENPIEKLTQLEKWGDNWASTSQSFLREWETDLKHKFNETLEGESDVSNIQSLISFKQTEKPFLLPRTEDGKPKNVPTRTIVATILNRNIISTARNPSVVRARLIQVILTALFGGFIYFRLEDSSSYSKAGACFFIMVNQGFMMTFSVITAFMSEKSLVIRERDAGLFSLSTFFISKVFSDLIFQFYLPIIYLSICWFIMGLNDTFWRFIVAVCYVFGMSLGVASIGYIVASFAPHIGVAVALGPVLILPFLMVSGFVIQKASLPKFWSWLYHLSPFVYAFSGLMRCVFLDVEYNLPSKDLKKGHLLGNDVLREFEISTDPERWWIDFGALVAWIILGRLFAWVLFVWTNRKRSKFLL